MELTISFLVKSVDRAEIFFSEEPVVLTYDVDEVEELASDKLVGIEVVGPEGPLEILADQRPATVSIQAG